jgi:catechol 2,3-dioxygenase-like lactoylglutathione lyase family enzyme
MAVHHIALATKDLLATHRFYTEAMGFRLAKVEANRVPTATGGWARHVFYDTGGDGMFAVWDLHDDEIGDDFPTAISTGVGLPPWVNHLAFTARDDAELQAALERWLSCGHDVVEIDHGWCRSIYVDDPNGTTVEWCLSTRQLDEQDAAEAERLLRAEVPELDGKEPPITVHVAAEWAARTSAATPVAGA